MTETVGTGDVQTRPHTTPFDGACALVETLIAGDAREEIVRDISSSHDFRQALLRLRDSMRSNAWKADGRLIGLGRSVREYDAATRQDGFHVLHDWDGTADRVNEDTIPVDVLHYLIEQRGADRPDARSLFILLDYYFAHLLTLLSLRIWDEGNADANLDRVNDLLAALKSSSRDTTSCSLASGR